MYGLASPNEYCLTDSVVMLSKKLKIATGYCQKCQHTHNTCKDVGSKDRCVNS